MPLGPFDPWIRQLGKPLPNCHHTRACHAYLRELGTPASTENASCVHLPRATERVKIGSDRDAIALRLVLSGRRRLTSYGTTVVLGQQSGVLSLAFGGVVLPKVD